VSIAPGERIQGRASGGLPVQGNLDVPEPPTTRPARSASRLLMWAMAVLIGVLVVPPVIAVIYSGFVAGPTLRDATFTLSNYAGVLQSPATYETLADTAIFALSASFVTIAVAAFLAWLVERTDAPFRGFVYLAAVVAFGIPTFIQGMGWILLLGPRTGVVNTVLRALLGTDAPQIQVYSMPMLVFVQTITLLPGMLLLLMPSFRATDPALEEAAQVSGASRWRVIRSMTIPLAAPSLLAALLLCLIICVEAFEIPALIGQAGKIIVLSTEIYGRIRRASPDYGTAGAYATILMVVAAAGLYAYQRATARSNRYATVTGKGYRPHRLRLGRWRWPAALATLGVPVATISPILLLAWGSFLRVYEPPSAEALGHLTLQSYQDVFETSSVVEAARNTLSLGAASAVIVMLLALVASWLLLRRRSGLTRAIDQLATLPLVIPGIVLALAVLRTFVVLPLPIYGTPAIILIAYVIHYLPYGMRFGHTGMIALHPELEEAGAVAGASLRTVLRQIVAPLMWPSLMAGGLFIFLASIRQLSLGVMLAGPGDPLIAPAMFDMWQRGSITSAAALGMVVVAVVVAVALVFHRLMRNVGIRQGEGTVHPAVELR
jgi:iron(III) transport system permease protein